MAERNLLFTWKLESFDEIVEQSNLLELRREFEMRGHSLSVSLLILRKIDGTGRYSLADFGNKKIYHFDR